LSYHMQKIENAEGITYQEPVAPLPSQCGLEVDPRAEVDGVTQLEPRDLLGSLMLLALAVLVALGIRFLPYCVRKSQRTARALAPSAGSAGDDGNVTIVVSRLRETSQVAAEKEAAPALARLDNHIGKAVNLLEHGGEGGGQEGQYSSANGACATVTVTRVKRKKVRSRKAGKDSSRSERHQREAPAPAPASPTLQHHHVHVDDVNSSCD